MDSDLLLKKYYENNAENLRKIVDKILFKFGGITQKDFDDFYSLANEVFVDVLRRYDGKQGFEAFLYSCLANKVKTEITRRNRKKRIADRKSISISMPIGDSENSTIGEILQSDFNVENEIEKSIGLESDIKVEKYLASLSEVQRKILNLKMKSISKQEIVEQLNITEKIYNSNFAELKSYDKTRKLLSIENKAVEEGKAVITQTSEISKNTNYQVSSYIKRLRSFSIRGDHPLQRNSNQWSNEQKYNLITTVLNRFPIPEVILAEQIKSYGVENWLIDGKQRLTNLSDYREGVFKVGKNAERAIIQYQVAVRDSENNIVLGDDGHPTYENREFDVRGKYYSDLPEELKEQFNDYTISTVQYLNCSDDDIEYHIRRYNAAKPMSVAQKGITHLGEQYARVAKKLTGHTFFKDCGSFRISEFTNGTMDRVVVESIMAINFLDDWKKRQEDICAFLKENVKIIQFDNFENMLNRLSEVITDDVSFRFNSKESFLWFSLFDRFTKSELEDEQFIDFMMAFNESLHMKAVGEDTYDSLNEKSTKDKNIVVKKLALLENLMNEFLHIKKEELVSKFVIEDEKVKRYILDFNACDIAKLINIQPEVNKDRVAMKSIMIINDEDDFSDKAIQKYILSRVITIDGMEDVLLYLESLGDWSVNVDNNSPIFCQEYLPALIKLVEYVYRHEIEEEIAIEFFENFVDKFDVDGEFTNNVKQNYNKVVKKLNRYVAYKKSKDA